MTCSNKLFRYNSLQNLMFDNNTLVCINLDTALSLYSQCVSLRYNLFQNSIFYNNTFVFINPDTTLSVFLVCIVKIQLALELNVRQKYFVCINLDTALSPYSQCVSYRYNLFQNSIFYNNTLVCINYTLCFLSVYHTDKTRSKCSKVILQSISIQM